MDSYEPHAIERSGSGSGTRPAPSSRRTRPTRAGLRRKAYVLEMLPYPSGSCTWATCSDYTLGDVVSHCTARGFSVLRPMGCDAFGLPAENAAIREGGHPREVTERNIAAIRGRSSRSAGRSTGTRELSTHEPDYYRWTQWLFLQLFEAGLAYRKAAPVKWCPNDQTVLANEQVIDGHCERCGAEVESRNLEQWIFRITDYADRLLDDMALLESWPERVLTMQRNWIGRSEGAEVRFRIEEFDEEVAGVHDAARHAVRRHLLRRSRRSIHWSSASRSAPSARSRSAPTCAMQRRSRARSGAAAVEKTGVFTGFYAINPVNDARMPI